MSPEAGNIFEMPPHLFWGSCPFWAKLRMAGRRAGRQARVFVIFHFRPLEQASLGLIIRGDKANPIGSGSPPYSAGGTSSPCLAARP